MPRSIPHAHGTILFVNSDGADDAAHALRERGHTEALIKIYVQAARMGGDIMLINFDQDADMVEGLPTFEW